MNDRFIRLSVSLSRLQKVIQRIKTDGMNRIELKAGHTLVLCQLDAAPDGYRFSELTERCDLDPAMISACWPIWSAAVWSRSAAHPASITLSTG